MKLIIEEINIHGTINKILLQAPKVALPIDFIPNDLKDWTKTLKVEVIVWLVEKYKDIDGNVLFSIPEKELEDNRGNEINNESGRTKGDIFFQVLSNGLLTEGEELYFE